MGAVGFGYSNGWAGMLYGVGGAIGILLVAVCAGAKAALYDHERRALLHRGSHLIKISSG